MQVELRLTEYRIPIEVIIADDEATGEGGITAAHQLINQDRVVALVGASLSRVAIRVAELSQERGIPLITTTASNPAITVDKDYVFRVIFTDTFQGQALAHFAFSDMGVGTAGVLYDAADTYSHGLAESFRDHFTLIGGRVVAFESYTTDVQQWDEQLSRLRTSNARLLLLPNNETVVPLQAAQARAIGIDVLLLGGDSWELVAPERRAPLEGGFFTTAYVLDSGTPQNEQFIADYQAAYGTMPDAAAAHAYDAFGLLASAMELAQRKDPRGIQMGLAGIRQYDGVTGSLRYNENGDPQKMRSCCRFKMATLCFLRWCRHSPRRKSTSAVCMLVSSSVQ